MNTTTETTINAAETIGVDLLSALVQEIRLLQKPWVSCSKDEQDDVIERLRRRVITNVSQAVRLIASDSRITLVGQLDKVTAKDGIQAVLKIDQNDPARHHLFDAIGKNIIVVVADAEVHMGDVGAVRGESDQRAFDLGNEYAPRSDGHGMEYTPIEALEMACTEVSEDD